MTRFSDWPERLDGALRDTCTRPFQYGTWDCCLAAADLILAMTGTDIAARWRGRYRSRKEALAVVKDCTGTRSIRAFLLHALADLPSIPVAYAQRGDLVLLRRPSDYSLGVLSLNARTILAPSACGYGHAPLALAVHAWRV
jgi:hypothetical protein